MWWRLWWMRWLPTTVVVPTLGCWSPVMDDIIFLRHVTFNCFIPKHNHRTYVRLCVLSNAVRFLFLHTCKTIRFLYISLHSSVCWCRLSRPFCYFRLNITLQWISAKPSFQNDCKLLLCYSSKTETFLYWETVACFFIRTFRWYDYQTILFHYPMHYSLNCTLNGSFFLGLFMQFSYFVKRVFLCVCVCSEYYEVFTKKAELR